MFKISTRLRLVRVYGCQVSKVSISWPLHDIAITNIVWQVLQFRVVGGKYYIAQ